MPINRTNPHVPHRAQGHQQAELLRSHKVFMLCALNHSGNPSKDRFVLWGGASPASTKVGKPLYCTQPHPVDILGYLSDQNPSPVWVPTTASKVVHCCCSILNRKRQRRSRLGIGKTHRKAPGSQKFSCFDTELYASVKFSPLKSKTQTTRHQLNYYFSQSHPFW